MKMFKFYAGTTISLMLLALSIALMIRYQAYLGYAGVGVVILVIIVSGIGTWSMVEKVITRRVARAEQQRRLELDEQAQSRVNEHEKGRLELDHQRALTERLRAQSEYIKAHAEAEALQMSVEQYRAALQAGLHYPGPHGAPVHISMDPVTGQAQIRATDYRALLPERAGAAGNRQTDPQADEENQIPTAPPFRAMSNLIRGAARLILCYGVMGAVYGTVDDLLSMAVTGKPGRGKTTALMYYVAILLSCGAEVVVWDPHGAMAELARLNNRKLPNMPETARVYYFDRKEDIIDSLPMLERNLEKRDDYYRQTRQTMHPHLLLADELPVLADYDEELARGIKRGEEAPSLVKLIRRYVLEARKWRCYFIGSGQSMDAEVLPTRVTENLSSRIVFFSSDRRARMAGLENDAIKKYLPQLRRAGSGVMVFDCARFDEPILGAIPMISIEDLMEFLGLPVDRAQMENMEPLAPNPLHPRGDVYGTAGTPHYIEAEADIEGVQDDEKNTDSGEKMGVPSNVRTFPFSSVQQPPEQANDASEDRPKDYRFTEAEIPQFLAAYRASGNVDRAIQALRKSAPRYRQHAKEILAAHNLRQA